MFLCETIHHLVKIKGSQKIARWKLLPVHLFHPVLLWFVQWEAQSSCLFRYKLSFILLCFQYTFQDDVAKKPVYGAFQFAISQNCLYMRWVKCIIKTYLSILAISLTASTPPGSGSSSMKKSLDSQILMAFSWIQKNNNNMHIDLDMPKVRSTVGGYRKHT